MLTDAVLIRSVNEFVRVVGVVYPNVEWEQLTTERGADYLLIYPPANGWQEDQPSWFVEQGPDGWSVIVARSLCDHVLCTGETPVEALEGATAKLVGALEALELMESVS